MNESYALSNLQFRVIDLTCLHTVYVHKYMHMHT